MRSGSKTHYVLETTGPRLAAALFRRILEAEGISAVQTRRSDDGFEIDGESSFPGTGVLLCPVTLFTGHGLDVRVHVRGQRSLDPGDDRIHVWVTVTALREWGSGPYSGLPHAGVLQCRRVARRIAARFDAGDGLAAGATASAQAAGATPGGIRPRNRGLRRRLPRIELVMVVAAVLIGIGWTYLDSRPPSGSDSGEATGSRSVEDDAQAVATREALRAEIARRAESPEEREALEGLLGRVHEGAWLRANQRAATEGRQVDPSDYRNAVREVMLMQAPDDPLLLIRIQVILGMPDRDD